MMTKKLSEIGIMENAHGVDARNLYSHENAMITIITLQLFIAGIMRVVNRYGLWLLRHLNRIKRRYLTVPFDLDFRSLL